MLSFQEQGGLTPICESYRRSQMQKPIQLSKISLTLPLWNLQTCHFGKGSWQWLADELRKKQPGAPDFANEALQVTPCE
jgi:hypothetical protein